jgi:hypothetical protein
MGAQVISIPPPMVADAGDDQTVYVNFVGIPGYPYSACADLTATIQGGTPPYSYEWSDGQTGQEVEVCPDVCTKYYVTITDSKGCIQKDSLVVYAIIVECMNGNNQQLKYLLCHNGNTICTSFSSTETHLSHGDGLGACGDIGNQGCEETIPIQGRPFDIPTLADALYEPEFRVLPNPADEEVNIRFRLGQPSQLKFILYTMQGQLIQSFGKYALSKGPHEIELPLASIQPGSYLLRVTDDTEMQSILKLMILH